MELKVFFLNPDLLGLLLHLFLDLDFGYLESGLKARFQSFSSNFRAEASFLKSTAIIWKPAIRSLDSQLSSFQFHCPFEHSYSQELLFLHWSTSINLSAVQSAFASLRPLLFL